VAQCGGDQAKRIENTREKKRDEPRGVASWKERHKWVRRKRRMLVGPTTSVILTSHNNVYEPAGHFAI